jgi:hypothetical protein
MVKKHILIDVANWSSEVYERIVGALSNCTLIGMLKAEDHEFTSMYKCDQGVIVIYSSRIEGLVDVLCDDEEVAYRVLSVLPREKIVVRFIERGFN